MDEYEKPVMYSFTIELPLTKQDIEDAEGDLLQAAQNVIGHTGAVVQEN